MQLYMHVRARRIANMKIVAIVSYVKAPLTATVHTVRVLQSGPLSVYKRRTTHKIAWIQLTYMQVDGAHAAYNTACPACSSGRIW